MLSVIIPTLEEESALPATLDRLQGCDEIVVVDGGSRDRTRDIARQFGAVVITAPSGRGPQLREGARAAKGDVLWFLHADTLAPNHAVELIRSMMSRPEVVAGNFALRFDGEDWGARWLTSMYPRLRRLGLSYGDSGFFVRRAAYEQAGGFADFPIFEDLDLLRRLRAFGRFVHLDCELTTSSRRWRNRSFSWTFAHWTALQMLFWMGVSPHRLARLYANIR